MLLRMGLVVSDHLLECMLVEIESCLVALLISCLFAFISMFPIPNSFIFSVRRDIQ